LEAVRFDRKVFAMPLNLVSLLKGNPPEYRRAILDGLYQAMREVFDVPEDDRFMTIDEYDKSNFLYGENYLGIARDDDLVIVPITVNNTRGPDKKKGSLRAHRRAGQKPQHQAGKHFGESVGSPEGELVVRQRRRAICASVRQPYFSCGVWAISRRAGVRLGEGDQRDHEVLAFETRLGLGWLLAGDPLVRQMRREFARLEHFPDNVAAADELAFDVKLRDRRPVGKFLDSLANLVACKTIHRLIGDVQIIQDLDDLAGKTALRKVRRSFHEQDNVVVVDRRLDFILGSHCRVLSESSYLEKTFEAYFGAQV
jgi:hypothetical protein